MNNNITFNKSNNKCRDFRQTKQIKIVKNSEPNSAENLSVAEAEIIKSLLNYPSLERVFDANAAQNLNSIKQKMRSTVDDLERVIRRGAKSDAEKAATAIKAIQTTLALLEEIEKSRHSNAR